MEQSQRPNDFICTTLLPQLSPPLSVSLQNILHLYERKLWYQLTLALQDFLADPASYPHQISLYQNFIKEFEHKINPLKLVEITVTISQRFDDAAEALTFLNGLCEELKPITQTEEGDQDTLMIRATHHTRFMEHSSTDQKNRRGGTIKRDAEAYVLAKMSAAHFCLVIGKIKQTEQAMDECREILEGLDSVDISVRAGFYRVSGDFYKWEAAYASYYKTSLLYLACLPNLDSHLSLEAQIQRAHDLSLAALLGDSIYNFGELLQHPILESLNASPEYQWIRTLLFGFHQGDLGLFESLTPRFPQEPILQNSYPFLRQKICLMALIDAVCKRNVTDRVIPFESIATETRLPVNEVEHLVMKALSLSLIKGSLDQVSRTIRITWVQPRVLTMEQLQGLKNKLDQWSQRVLKTGEFAQTNGGNEISVH